MFYEKCNRVGCVELVPMEAADAPAAHIDVLCPGHLNETPEDRIAGIEKRMTHDNRIGRKTMEIIRESDFDTHWLIAELKIMQQAVTIAARPKAAAYFIKKSREGHK